jgi:hypothetical protein
MHARDAAGEQLRERRVAHVAVEDDDSGVRPARGRERLAERAPSHDPLARRPSVRRTVPRRKPPRLGVAARKLRPDHQPAPNAELGNRPLGILQRLVAPPASVLDDGHAVALHRGGEDRHRSAVAGQRLGMGPVDLLGAMPIDL